jgi:hypothetical protein
MVEEVSSACFVSQTTGVTSVNRVLLRRNGRRSLLRISCVSTAPQQDIEAMSVVVVDAFTVVRNTIQVCAPKIRVVPKIQMRNRVQC